MNWGKLIYDFFGLVGLFVAIYAVAFTIGRGWRNGTRGVKTEIYLK